MTIRYQDFGKLFDGESQSGAVSDSICAPSGHRLMLQFVETSGNGGGDILVQWQLMPSAPWMLYTTIELALSETRLLLDVVPFEPPGVSPVGLVRCELANFSGSPVFDVLWAAHHRR